MADVTWADGLTAVGTFLAVVVALGLAGWEWIRRRIWRPELDVVVEPRSPDGQIIRVGGVGGSYWAFYCRLQIHNTGSRRAHGVQVRMIRLVDGSGPSKGDADFVPMNLVWSNVPRNPLGSNIRRIELPALVPELPQHCDFCFFTHTEPPLVQFCTEETPNAVGGGRWPTKKPPGQYRADIAVAAENAKTIYRTLGVVFTGKWSDNVDEMAATNLRVTVRREPDRPRSINTSYLQTPRWRDLDFWSAGR